MQFTDYDGIIDANELLLDVSRNEIEARINRLKDALQTFLNDVLWLQYIPNEDHLAPDTVGKKYGRCAVVGNSGTLLNTSYGAQIDQYDTVIRFNAAPTRGTTTVCQTMLKGSNTFRRFQRF